MAGGIGMGTGRGPAGYTGERKYKGVKLDKGIFKRLLSYGVKYWHLFLASFFMIMVVSLFRLLSPLIMKVLIDEYIQKGTTGGISAEEAISGVRYMGFL